MYRTLRILAIAGAFACSTPDTEVLSPLPVDVDPPRSCDADSTAAPADAVPRTTHDADVPTLPVGIDAYTRWNLDWPIVRIGTRTYMRSTAERGGDNYDSSHFIRKRSAAGSAAGRQRYVGLDAAGSGVLWFARANHWHGSPWHYVVDGNDNVVTESSTSDPDHPIAAGSHWMPENAFPSPLAVTWSTTKGADLSWVPISFSSTLSIEYERTHYGTGYWVYSVYPSGATNLSRAPCTWQPSRDSSHYSADSLAVFSKSAEEVVASDLATGVETTEGSVALNGAGATTRVARIDGRGPTTLRAISFDVSEADASAFGKARLRITWDDRSRPSIEAPVNLFFGAGSIVRTNDYLVRAFPVSVRFASNRVRFTTIFPMPFTSSATIELVADAASSTSSGNVAYSIKSTPTPAEMKPDSQPRWLGYLHATFHDFPSPVPGKDNVLLDTTLDESSNANGSASGNNDWCGSFIGTSFSFTDRVGDKNALTTLEGDPRFFFDDSQSPQGQGTGTEEWGGGGDYWEGGQTMTLPFVGHPVFESAYRFLLGDAMPFGKNARIRMEHGGVNQSTEHYRSVTYWYGAPGACLALADSLHVGDSLDEERHAFTTQGAVEAALVTSRYDEGVDHDADGNETYPEITDNGRTVARRATFRISIPKANLGVLLRRRLDYAIADQRAVVFVADGDRDDAPFVRAGVWYVAGSTNVLFADSPTELPQGDQAAAAAAAEQFVVSPHRWRDDEFLLPRSLTEGRSRIRIRLDVVSPEGLSAFRLHAFTYQLPTPIQ